MNRPTLRRVAAVLAWIALTAWYFAEPSKPLGARAASAMVQPVTLTSVYSPQYVTDASAAAKAATTTPIKHLVVIFQENVSFDHYFATYPNSANPPGEPRVYVQPNTPTVNNLQSAGLLAPNNPNSIQPFRLDRSQSLTCDMNHEYTAEQEAVNGGKMDKFVEKTSGSASNSLQYCPKGTVMGYYDGNTVTALWNYAQYFSMNDNSYGTTYGPSTPGVLNLISGQTAGAVCGNDAVYNAPASCSPSTTIPSTLSPSSKTGTVIADPDQFFDDWSAGGYGSKNTAAMVGRNVGDLLNSSNVTWGWFNGGFDVKASHPLYAYDRLRGVDPATDTTTLTSDYSAHHQGFQYYASTSNPHHLTPSSTNMIGQTDQANHQYDLTDFWAAADAHNLPAVSFLKAPKYQDGHAGYSTPLDEQQFLVETINHLMSLPSWKSTAIVIGYDDSDGWYDHAVPPLVNRSNTSLDANCGAVNDGASARCGFGPRLPYIVISPFARQNFVDHTLTDQSSTLRFIEDNWLGGQRISADSFDNRAGSIQSMFDWTQHNPANRRLLLNPITGERQ